MRAKSGSARVVFPLHSRQVRRSAGNCWHAVSPRKSVIVAGARAALRLAPFVPLQPFRSPDMHIPLSRLARVVTILACCLAGLVQASELARTIATVKGSVV